MNAPTNTHTLPTICPLDCPDTCSLSVTVKNDKVTAVRGSRANPYTDNAICSKVAKSYPEFIHGEHRLTHPLMRTGKRGTGEYQQISWDEAIDRVYEGFQKAIQQHGGESVLGFNYAGPHGELAAGSMDRRFLNNIGATQLNRGPLCAGVRNGAYESLFGSATGMNPEQVMHADLAIVWGGNTSVSYLHLSRLIKKAQKQGCKLVVVDPKRIPIADHADCFIQINPGTDTLLAMGLATELERQGVTDPDFIDQWVTGYDAYMQQARTLSRKDILDTCGISRDDFDALIKMYQQSNNTIMSLGNGMERGINGGSSIRAVMSLQAITGNMGRPGTGIISKVGNAFPKNSARLQANHLLPENTREINILDVSKALLDDTLSPPIKAVLIYNHNPIAMHPDQSRMHEALMQEDVFIVGCDISMTDSMAYADIILPAASSFEADDIYAAYGQSYLQRAEPVIPAVGESLPNTEIFRRLAARFGFDDELFTATDQQLMNDAFNQDDPSLHGQQPSSLPVDSALPIKNSQQQDFILCDDIAPLTPSGKIELYSEALEQTYGYGLPRHIPVQSPQADAYPLMLLSPSSNERTNAIFGGCKASHSMQPIEINPDDAAQRNITDGDEVIVNNSLGKVHFIAKISDRVKAGVMVTPKGAWLNTSPTRQTVNALINADLRSDIMDGACYNDTWVNVKKLN